MMHKNPFWLGLICCMTLITLWYLGNASLQFFRYTRLQESAQATEIRWSVKEMSSEEFIPFAHYLFKTKDGEMYEGEGGLNDSRYRNAWAVEEDLSSFAKKRWKVWYNPSYPHQSALQKNFPLKECLSAIALLILWIYFVGLGFYVGHQKA